VDPLGEELLQHLQSQGYSVEFIQRDSSKPTGTVRVQLDEKGIPSFQCSRDVAFDYLEWTDTWAEVAHTVDAVLFGTLAQREPSSRRTIQRFLQEAEKAFRIFDPNLREISPETPEVIRQSLSRADILKISEEELRLLQRLFSRDSDYPLDFLNWLEAEFDLDSVVVTLGELGSFALRGTKQVYSPGFVVPVEDTTGAGDAYMAAYVIGTLEGWPLEEVLEFANAVGAFVCTQKGAVPKYRLSDIKGLRKRSVERRSDPSLQAFAEGGGV